MGPHPLRADTEPFEWSGRSVVVTGANGFIGRHLVAELISAGARVRMLVRHPEKLATTSDESNSQCETVVGDLTDPVSLVGLCKGIDTVLHLAGYAHADDRSSNLQQSLHWRITVEGTKALLEDACSTGVKRFVFVSSVKAMGEGSEVRLDESSPALPEDYYGISKLEAERLVLAAGQRCGMHTSILRLPMVYGRDNAGNLPQMITAIRYGKFPPLPDTHNKRSMVHVDDVVQALLLAAGRNGTNGRIYIITDDETYSSRRIYVAICDALGKRLPTWYVPSWMLRFAGRCGDVLRAVRLPAPLTSSALNKLLGSAWYSCERAKQEIGYQPSRKLEESLPEMVSEMRAQQPQSR
jgi:nucleoside-diphosphate-sugar epimerase